MANTRFYLDERKTKANKPCVLKVAIAHHGVTALISLDAKVLPQQWDSKKLRVINHPDEMLMNLHITHTKQLIDTAILSLAHEGCLDTMKASEVKSRVLDKLKPERVEVRENEEFKATSFAVRFLKFADSKKPSTRGVYMQTYSRLVAFAGEDLEKLRFEDITKEWLTKFETFMAQTAPSKNARNIHLRNIRAVFNEANFHAEPFMQYYLDIFKLNFMLIGINMVDLCRLKEIVDGRITFHRAKTNRLYSIKVEPEALEIIERHRGENWLIDILDHYKNHNDFTRKINKNLQKVGPMKRVGLGGKKIYSPLFPQLTTYWARHTWATIAAVELDIPKDIIAHALGHGNNTVTDIYIDFDQSKVDVANRRVLDYVLYGKR